MIISMEVVLTRFLSIETPIIRAGFGFLPIAVAAAIFGPVAGGAIYSLSDIIGVMLVLRAPFHAGFTISAFLTGMVYGLYLYKKPKTVLRVFLAVLTINLFIDVGLNTYWLSNLYHQAYGAILAQRVIKSAIMIPVQTTVICFAWRYLGKFIESSVLPKIGFKLDKA